jgi:hypothetical protein
MSFTKKFAKFAKFSCAPARMADGDGLRTPAAAAGLNHRLNAEPSPELKAMKLDEPELKAMKLDEMDGMGGMNEAELDKIDEALREFRLSVHAWSAQVQSAHAQNACAQKLSGWNDAASGQPRRALTPSPRRRMRRLALGWAMGCVLVAAGLSAGLWEHYRQPAGMATAHVAEPHWLAPARQGQRILEPVLIPGKLAQDKPAQDRPAQEAKEDLPAKKEDLLARVDSDVSRQVPSAMEPLAELMAGDESQ